MSDSTLTVAEHHYLQAFRELFPTRLLKRAVAASGRATRERLLPLYVLLGMLITWFFKPQDSLPNFVRWLVDANHRTPSEPAVYAARGRLGWAPLRWLHEHVVRPLACRLRDPDAFYQGMRLYGLDGSTFTVADTPANDRYFGRAKNQHGRSGYPQARLVALCEVGTHALVDWVVRSYRRAESSLAVRLLRRLTHGVLLLADRGFHSFEFWSEAKRGGYELLIRVSKTPKFAVDVLLPDGSYLSWVLPRRGKNKKARAIRVRVIHYQWTDEKGKLQQARLVTSLLDATAHPAAQLVALYHRRWEHEVVLGEIKEHLAGPARPMHIRAKDPVRVCQEVDGLLLGHYTVRWAMLQAARAAGVPAVRLSFTGALRVLEVRLARIPQRPKGGQRWWRRWWKELLQAMGRRRVRARKNRRCPRARKVTRSHWPVKKPEQKEGTTPTLEVVPPAAKSSP